MEKRSFQRWMRRLRVRFWRRGDEEVHLGHTVNLSTRGMYIGTGKPLKSGTRVRVEVLDPEEGFIVEGIVAHSHEVAPELHRIEQPGMGVKLLGVQELMGELLQVAPAEGADAPRPGPAEVAAGGPGAGPSPRAQAPSPSSAPPRSTPSVTVPGPGGFGAPSPSETPGTTPGEGASFRVEFRDRKEFIEAFRQHVIRGGFYVPTQDPPQLDEEVRLRIVPPTKAARPFELPARVVQRILPASSGGGSLARPHGMGVEFLDPDEALARFEPVVKRLGG